MDLNILISQFFTDEEVKRAFTSIWGTMEDGGYPITKYSVIDEFDEPLQRICDFINELQNHINNLIVTRNNPIIVTTEECKSDIVSKPSLPADVDEVAEEYAWKKEEPLADGERLSFCFNPRIDAFKAGAEWMDGQGVKIGETEIYLEDDGEEPPYSQQWLDIENTEFKIPNGAFKPGDKVEVILRKR